MQGRSWTRVIDWRRLAIALPVLAALVAVMWWLLREEDATATTPKASLLETAAVGSASVGVDQGETARDFEAAGHDGDTIRLSALRGTPTVLTFWATWCTSCLAEMPDLKAVQQEFGAENLRVVAVNSGESVADAEEFINWLEAPDFLYAFDPSLTLTDAFGVIGLSSSVFIDAEGVIRARYTGQLTRELMREFSSAATAGSDAAEPPPRLRLPGTVEARQNALFVDEEGSGVVTITSRRLRCDDVFCAEAAIAELASLAGVQSIDHDLRSDPPTITVQFDGGTSSGAEVAERLAAIVAGAGDPLYQSPPTVEFE